MSVVNDAKETDCKRIDSESRGYRTSHQKKRHLGKSLRSIEYPNSIAGCVTVVRYMDSW